MIQLSVVDIAVPISTEEYPNYSSPMILQIVEATVKRLAFEVFSGNPSGVMSLLEQYDPGKSQQLSSDDPA